MEPHTTDEQPKIPETQYVGYNFELLVMVWDSNF